MIKREARPRSNVRKSYFDDLVTRQKVIKIKFRLRWL